MRIVFMGTPEFARKPLERLFDDGHDIAGVFTQADKPRNRGMKSSFCPVKEFAMERGARVFQPATLRDGNAVQILSELEAELAGKKAPARYPTAIRARCRRHPASEVSYGD